VRLTFEDRHLNNKYSSYESASRQDQNRTIRWPDGGSLTQCVRLSSYALNDEFVEHGVFPERSSGFHVVTNSSERGSV
jgi:hypothetical protein